jgi:predicted xylose isomerase-like sugar epimerase
LQGFALNHETAEASVFEKSFRMATTKPTDEVEMRKALATGAIKETPVSASEFIQPK